MDYFIHQTHHQVADFKSIFDDLKNTIKKHKSGIHLYPELYLTGYPLQDLCLQKSFVTSYQKHLKELNSWLKKLKPDDSHFLVGGLEFILTKNGIPEKIKNVVYYMTPGEELKVAATKRLLPNYDIFDEKKYYTEGEETSIIKIEDEYYGLLVCEDMWASTFHDIDPVKELEEKCKEEKINLKAVFNLSASPFNINKCDKRIQRAKDISHALKSPFVYVNRVGGEDEVIFDGRSFLLNGDTFIHQLAIFKADSYKFSETDITSAQYNTSAQNISKSWEDLFSPRVSSEQNILSPLNEEELKVILGALCFGLQEYATKSGFKKFTIALSGGMDSALVLAIAVLSLKEGQDVEAIYMPSIHSSPLSHDLSLQLCQKLGVNLKTMPIKFLHSATKNLFESTYPEPFEGLTDENIQSRLRGALLYTRSNQTGSMIINTSNKSEIAVGYSTQYGDSVGAISLLGDLFKSEVYQLANFINKHFDNIIPEGIITREPSAELREGQLDSDSLPEYSVLDSILEALLSNHADKDDLLKAGFKEEQVDKVLNLYKRTEYKRAQFAPIIKINAKSFGFGYRIPSSRNLDFYNN